MFSCFTTSSLPARGLRNNQSNHFPLPVSEDNGNFEIYATYEEFDETHDN